MTAADAPPVRSTLARTATGAGWIIGWRFATRFIGLGSTLILVRLLTPADFGIVTLAVGLIQGLDSIAGFGVEGAIIRIEDPGRDIYDSGFTINVVRGVLTAAVMAAAAIPIAHFFNDARLAPIIWVLSAGWGASAFKNIGMVEYRRLLAFDMEFKSNLIPRLLSLAVTIPAALIWRSYWALIAGTVANQLITVVLTYRMHPYRPRFGTAGMRRIASFSLWEWMIGLMWMIGGRTDTIVIGRVIGTAAVGIYGVGGEIASLPGGEIVAPLCRALFSGFVEEKREGNNGTATLLRVLSLLAVITFPLCMGLSLVAYPVIRLAFGQEWMAAVPLLELFGVASILSIFNPVAEALFSAHAWLRTMLWMAVGINVLRVVLLLLLIPSHGLMGAAVAVSITGVVFEFLYGFTAVRRLQLSPMAIFASVLRPGLAVIVMAVVLSWAKLGWNTWSGEGFRLGLQLAVAVALGAVTYVLSLLGLWLASGLPAGAEADGLDLLRRTWRRVRRRH